MQKEKFVNYNVEQLRVAITSSLCYSDVCRQLGVTICDFSFRRIKRLCEEYSISVSHFDTKSTFRRGKVINWTAATVFVENCSITRSMLRPVLIRLGFYTGTCDSCNTPDVWNGNPLTIEIDHVNGVSTDNRIENLRWLCPNCQSQTTTYRRRTTLR